MPTIQLRRVTDAVRQTITPALGEPIFCTDTGMLYDGDGVTKGGVPVVTSAAVAKVLSAALSTAGMVIDGGTT